VARGVAKIGIGLLVVVGVGAVVAMSSKAPAVILAQPLPTQAEVAALVDGDTFDVRSNDQITRVRLGYVDTPGTPRPGEPAACLAREASARLASMVPAGTPLKLTYGQDRFGRTTAEAVTLDGRLVNAEVVRSGFAQAVRDESETPIPASVDAAAQEALANKRGAHAAGIACTVPGRVKALNELVARVSTIPLPGARALDLAISADSATEVRMAAEELDSAFEQNRQAITWLALAPSERTQLQSQVRVARDRAAAAETMLRNAANTLVNKDATLAAVNGEAALIAKKLADIRKAEADRAAEAARRAAAALEAQAYAAAEEQAREDKKAGSKRGGGNGGGGNGGNGGGGGGNGGGGNGGGDGGKKN
jgi:micrococcal nuclease